MRKIPRVILLLMSIVTLLSSFSGCGEAVLQASELPHYDYSDSTNGGYNTKLFYANSYQIPMGDPAVLPVQEADGLWYYATGTKSGKDFRMWRTKDFTNWEDLGAVYTPPSNFFGTESFWAPQLLFDPEADWQYYLGQDAGEGKGLYILCFSARGKDGICQVTVTFSKKIDGPYTHFEGKNQHGDTVSAATPLFQIEKLMGLWLYANHTYGDLYKENRSFIDACPYIDPLTGDKYFYMVRSRNVDASNDVWGFKMKDWVTPDYKTTTPLSSYGYTTIDKKEEYNFTTKNKIDEGPFVYYKDDTDDGVDNGKYYLTLSIGDTNDKLYPVCQAIGDSPLGPFTKIQPEDGGLLNCPEMMVDIHGCGHHAFFEVGDELYIAYHTYEITSPGSIGSRYLGIDKVEWTYNEKGQYVMYSNGPTKNIQPLPAASSGYKNLATSASVGATTGTAENAALLNDGLIAHSADSLVKEFTVDGDVVITLKFDNYIKARAIMIYNSYDYNKCFESIERIEFSYRKEVNGAMITGVAYIDELGFNFDGNMIPQDYLRYSGENEKDQLRPCGAAIAEFNELEIIEIKISVKKLPLQKTLCISEITVLGKELE